MKKKIQKYLAGEREGFSLVELIIVIAIMAILVGVVALAVLPNIEKSKESKDFAVLDSVCSALNAAVASTQAKASGIFDIDGTGLAAGSEQKKVYDAVIENLGSGAKDLTCSAASGSDVNIYCHYDVTNGTIEVYAAKSSANTTALQSKYNGDLKVSN